MGYGAFAKKFIPRNTIFEYTGYLSNNENKSSMYTWTTEKSNKNKSKIDASIGGNLMRFVNDSEDHNMKPSLFASENRIPIKLYVADRDI